MIAACIAVSIGSMIVWALSGGDTNNLDIISLAGSFGMIVIPVSDMSLF